MLVIIGHIYSFEKTILNIENPKTVDVYSARILNIANIVQIIQIIIRVSLK